MSKPLQPLDNLAFTNVAQNGVMEFGHQLQKRRKTLQLTQQELALAVNLDHRRISDYESLRREPDAATRLRLARFLDLPPEKAYEALGRVEDFCPRRVYVRPGERTTSSRIAVAEYRAPNLVRRLKGKISPAVMTALDRYACSSCWEAFPLLYLAAFQAGLVLIRPLDARFFQHSVLHPIDGLPAGHLKFPALKIRWKGKLLVFLPQVPVLAGGHPFTLDFLVGVKRRDQPHWIDLEVDGEGHDASGDAFRTRCLAMPTIRYEPSHLVSENFMPSMLDAILASIPSA